MKKRTPTIDPNIVVYPHGIHYFRRGQKEISLKTKDFREAQIRKRFVEARGDSFLTVSLRLTFNDVIPLYLDDRKDQLANGEIRQATYRETKDLIELYLAPFFGKKSVAKTDSLLWESFKKTRGLPRDLTNLRKVFSHLTRWCVKHGHKKDLLILDIPKFEGRERRILKPDEMRSIWNSSTGSLRLFISLALFMGMRRLEIITLEWTRIDLTKSALFIPKHISKTKIARWVSINAVSLALLKERKLEQKKLKTNWVFPNREDKNRHADRDGLRTAWDTCLMRAFNLKRGDTLPDITWHDLRATCEYYAHKRTDVTATQLEKFFGASVDVQRKIYVSMDADDVRGVESSPLLLENTMGITGGELP